MNFRNSHAEIKLNNFSFEIMKKEFFVFPDLCSSIDFSFFITKQKVIGVFQMDEFDFFSISKNSILEESKEILAARFRMRKKCTVREDPLIGWFWFQLAIRRRNFVKL